MRKKAFVAFKNIFFEFKLKITGCFQATTIFYVYKKKIGVSIKKVNSMLLDLKMKKIYLLLIIKKQLFTTELAENTENRLFY